MTFRASLLILFLLAAPASAQTAAQTDPQPNIDVCFSGEKLLGDVTAALRQGGLAALAPLAPTMQEAVTGAHVCFPYFFRADSAIMLADGKAETLMATMAAAIVAKKTGLNADIMKTQFNPFPRIAFILGSYYNETGKPQDALNTLDKGFSLSTFPDSRVGDTVYMLTAEKGAALTALKRFDDALKDYDEGLKIKNLANPDQARFQRGRGFALTELGRLDDAESAYREALKLDPNDTRAPHELAYIAGLKAGRPKTEGYSSTKAPPANGGDVPMDQRAKKADEAN
jgi:tetratricopeptide (TPR) repeat protein